MNYLLHTHTHTHDGNGRQKLQTEQQGGDRAGRKLLCGGGGGGDTEAHFPNPPLLGRRDGKGGSGRGCPTCRARGGGGSTQHLWLKMIPTSR